MKRFFDLGFVAFKTNDHLSILYGIENKKETAKRATAGDS